MQALKALLSRHAWRTDRSLLAQVLRPVSWLYRALFWLQRARAGGGQRAPVPTVVIGNVVVGGVGKTPLVISLVQALQAAGWRPGVLSRGYKGISQIARAVDANSAPQEVGDEPLLVHRRTGVPTWVGRQRLHAARALCRAHPEVDVLVCDDGLQHHALAADAAWLVFDARGAGNGLLLPAGPLREPVPAAAPPNTWVVYTGAEPSTLLPGPCVPRALGTALPLESWRTGSQTGALPLAALRGRALTALAGIATPQAFFKALQDQGLKVEPLPMPDHAAYDQPPWPVGTQEVITTEKDAVKLTPAVMSRARARGRGPPQPQAQRQDQDQAAGNAPPPAVWVVPLDCELPAKILQPLLERLREVRRAGPNRTNGTNCTDGLIGSNGSNGSNGTNGTNSTNGADSAGNTRSVINTTTRHEP